MRRALNIAAIVAGVALLLAVFASFAVIGAAFALPISHHGMSR